MQGEDAGPEGRVAKMKTQWLDRRIAHPGPHLALCLSAEEFHAAMLHVGADDQLAQWVAGSDAQVHFAKVDGKPLVAVVCIDGWQGRDPIEVAGLLVHEAVHVWQRYARDIGEEAPGDEQEAYAIQSIAQELLAEFARRTAP